MDDIVKQKQSYKAEVFIPTLLQLQKIQKQIQTQSLHVCINTQNIEQKKNSRPKIYIDPNPNQQSSLQKDKQHNLQKSIQQTNKSKSFNITDLERLTVNIPKEQIIMLQRTGRQQLQTKQYQKMKNKQFTKPQHRNSTHKKNHHRGQSEHSSNLQQSNQLESMDSFEEFKQYKKRKKSNSIKFLIKKVENLQKQVKQLKSENNHLQQSKQQKKTPEIYPINKPKGLMSNLISIKVESQNVSIKEDILIELKKLREKVDNLESKSIDVSRIKHNSVDQFNFSPRNTIQQKHQNLSNLINEPKTMKQTGKIFKKSEMKQIEADTQKIHKEQNIEKPQLINNLNELDLKQNIKQDIKNEQKRRDAITIIKQIQKQKNGAFQEQKIEVNVAKQSKSQIFIKTISIENASKQSYLLRDSEHNIHQLAKTNENNNKYQMIPTNDDHGFKRSGNPIPNINVSENVSRSDWQQSLKMLQFDMGKQKFVIDVNNTSDEKKISKLSKNVSNQINSFQEAEELVPSIPKVTIFPNYDTPEQQLIQIGKQLFSSLKVQKINDETTVLNVRKYKNCTYFGIDPENNILMYYEGKIYFGGWKQFMNSEGQKCGNGLQFQYNKFIYKGQFNNGKRNGFGVLKVTNNSQSNIYIGQFIDGVKHGEGKQINQDNVLYDGEWKDGKKDGFGKYILSKSQIYQGTFQQGLKSGHGMEHFKNGDRYQGEYLTGKFHGKGRYYWSNDSVYEGQFKNGMRNGYGIWRSQNNLGDIYEGTYENDMKNGHGVYHWANGSTYDGNFSNDKKHGKGTITDENGKAFNYEWQNDNILRKSINQLEPQILSNSNIRNFNKILPVNRKFSSSKDKVQKNINNEVGNTNSLNNIRISRSTSNMQRAPSRNRHTHHQQQVTEGHKVQNAIKPHLITERPLTSKSVSNQSNSTFKLQRKSAVAKSTFPKDPPYRKMRSTANIINF